MKECSKILRISAAVAAATLLVGSASARIWTSADGSNTFEGDLVGYDAATGMVKVNRDGKVLTFDEKLLSEDDIAFVKEEAPKLAKPSVGGTGGRLAGDLNEIPEVLPDPDGEEADMSKPVKVFILLGQSNMLGFGKIDGGDGSLKHAATEKDLYPYLVDAEGEWTVRKDVRNVFIVGSGFNETVNGWMTGGEGNAGKIGPEIGIGYVMGELFDAPVMILKVCIGNRSLGWDLLPPSVKAYEYDGKLQPGYGETPETAGSGKKDTSGAWYAGKQWDTDIGNAQTVLENLSDYYPGAKDYEVAGFFWWQGDKDMRNPAHFNNYEKHLEHLLKDLRKEFNCPDAPLVTASLGQTAKDAGGGQGAILDAMESFSKNKDPEFDGKVGFVYTNPLSKGGSSSGHYNGNAETYQNVGEAMGREMARLFLGQ